MPTDPVFHPSGLGHVGSKQRGHKAIQGGDHDEPAG